MTSYHRIVARGWRVMVVLALMLSTMPLDVAAAQPMESVGQPTIRSAVAATAGDSIEESRQTRDQAAALDQIVQPAPSAPNAVDITATKRDALVVDVDNDNRADPGDTLEYTVVLTDSGSTDATGVQFNDTLDANTTLVGGSLSASPVAVNDTYPQTIIGNVSINSALIPFSVISNDYVGLNPAATITAYDETSANGGTVVVNTDGTFTYDPPPGFEGTDTFSYTLSNSTGSSIAAVSISVSGMVWFVNSTAPSCTSVSNGCGRLSHPFSTLAAFNTANGAADVPASHIFNPAANDNVFIYENAAAYTGAVTLLSGQKLIGQDATASLSAITGLTPPSSSASFPAMNSGNATFTNIVSTVTLNNNVTVRGLQINSTTSTGMNDPASAISGVNVSEVSIATTTGTAVLLSSTGGIFSFTSVSANGAANGISLAGTTGSFTVTGNGGTCTSLASTCTGGAIQNTTGHGISLSNVASPSFNYMKIANNANSGIFGTGVVNFTLANSVIDGVNTAHTSTDGDVAFNLNGGGSTENNLSGNVSITNNTLNNSYQDGINILNYAGTISNLTITNNHLTSNSNAANSAGSAILVVEGRGASASFITVGNISGNTINNFPNGGGVVVHVGNTAAGPSGSIASLANPLLIQDNVITGAGAGASGLGTNGVELTVGHQSDGYFTVGGAGHGNTITNVRGNGVACSKFGDNGSSGSTKCTISFNTVNAHNTVNSPGINTGADSATSNTNTPTLYLSIHDNNISNTTGNGILSTVRSTNGTGVFSIQNNTIAQPTTSSGTIYGIRVDSGNGAEATGATVCLKISGNTTAGSTNGSITAPGIGLRQNHTAIVSSFQIDGLSPTPANDAQMEAYVGNVGQNPGSANGTFGATGVAAISGGGTYTAGTCIIPGPVAFNLDTPAVAENSPAVQLTARNDVAAQTAEVVPASQSIVSAMPLEFAGAFKQTTWHETNYVTSIAPATVNAPNSGETVNVTIGPLPSNKSITIKFRASINDPIPAGILQVSNQGTVSGGNFSNVLTDDPDTGIANDPTVTPLDIQVDLQITKAVSPTTAYPGAPITYTIAYLNAGPQASANVVISDPLPSALTNVTYQSSATITPTGSYVWTIGTLSNGQGGTITVTGMISSALGVPTTITNTATITGTGRDTNASNNTASVGLPITDQPIGGLNAANSSPTQLGSATNFTATVSAGTSVVYQWNFGDGATSSGATSAHTYAAVGMYTATVTATNSANSQVATTSVTVVDVPISGLNAANSSPTRLGSATNFTATISSGSNVAYAWNFGDGATGSGATSAHTYATIGTYTATVTATNSVNQQVAATVVTVIDRPISGLTAANDSPTQLGNTTHFTATISGGSNVAYQWNFGDGAVASGANTSHIYGAVGSYVATVTATNGVSVVVASTNASIVDVPISGLTATNSSPTVLGNSTAFTAAISGGTNATYAWNFGDGSTGSGANASHIYAAIGAYTATVTATNTSGSVIATTVATIYDTPITGLTAASNSPTRLGNATHFTATTTGGSGIGYAWSFGDGNVGSGANPSHTYAALGTYTATVTATNSLNSQTANTIVVVIDQPIVGLAAANDSPTRLGSVTHFTATLSNGTHVTYQWDFGDGSTGSGVSTSHTYALVGSYLATVTATNSVSVVVATTNVSIIDTPIVNLSAANSSPTQLGSATTFTATIGSGSNVGYQWNFGDGSAANGANASHTYGAVGAYVATVTATNGVSVVVATTNVSIIDRAIVGLNAANSSPTGLGNSTAFTATISDGTNVVYAWNFGDGSLGSGATSAHTYSTIGAYTATVTATNGVSVVVANTVATVSNQPIAGLTAASSSPTRLGSATAFTATITTGSSVSYAWDFGDGTTGSGANAPHTYAAIGTYTATVTATNSINSQTAATVVVVIDRAIAGLSASNDSPTRLNSTTNLTATIADGSNVTYQWNFGDGSTGSGANANHVYSAVGAYVATVTATNSVSVVVATTNVSIIDTPIVNLAAANSSPTGLNLSTFLTVTISSGSNVVYAWNFGDGVTGSGATTSHLYPALGLYTATVTATNGVSNVVATTLVTIVDQPITTLNAVSNSPTLFGNTTFFTATANGTSVIYAWNFGDGAAGSGLSLSHTYAAIGQYTAVVTATNSLGLLTATVKVNVFSGKTYLPLIMRNYVSAPDLVVTSLKASTGHVQVVIKNQGDRPATDGFYVDVYINPHPAPVAVNQIWSDGRSAQGLTWGVTSSMQPGQVLTLTIGDAYYLSDYSVFTGTLPIGTPVYAQVDSYDPTTTYGAVLENHEINGGPYNNILGPILSTATFATPDVLPPIDKGHYWLPVRLKVQ